MDYPNHALSLREWLDHLQRTDRLAVAIPEGYELQVRPRSPVRRSIGSPDSK